MGLDVRMYPSANPSLGGAIDTAAVLGTLVLTSEQSVSAASWGSVTSEQATEVTRYFHKKVWLKNHEAVSVNNPEIWFEDSEYPDQITVARAGTGSGVVAHPYAMPAGFQSSDFISCSAYEDRIALKMDSSALTATETAALWVRIKAAPGLVADASAVTTLKLQGYRN